MDLSPEEDRLVGDADRPKVSAVDALTAFAGGTGGGGNAPNSIEANDFELAKRYVNCQLGNDEETKFELRLICEPKLLVMVEELREAKYGESMRFKTSLNTLRVRALKAYVCGMFEKRTVYWFILMVLLSMWVSFALLK